jgi:hypothetical protein
LNLEGLDTMLTSSALAADLAGCPTELVRSWIASGRLKVKKVNMGVRYVQLEEVDRLWAAEQARAIDEAQGKPKRKKAKTAGTD